MTTLIEMGKSAREAGRKLARFTTAQKNNALHVIADALEAGAEAVLHENAKDIERGHGNNLSDAMLDRLLLTHSRIQGLADDTRKVALLEDPVGIEIESRVLPNGMRLSRRRTPIGVLGVIYEARPNVTIDIATLCLKTSNAVILRGGSETLHSNLALARIIQEALKSVEFPQSAVQYIENPDRALVSELLRLDRYVDMIIPRGGRGLHRLCLEQSTIPVITGGMGICHIFVDESADLNRALDIIENAKVQRPSVCNALDTLLVHQSIAADFLPRVADRLSKSRVSFRAAGDALRHMTANGNGIDIRAAGPDDFDQEWLGLILGVKIVQDVDEAITHVHRHSTEHSDSILTNNWANANRFVDRVNASAVFVNASTRFNDGGQFGLGAEVAVSTQKLHARGPMGLEELTTYKWICIGDGHIRT